MLLKPNHNNALQNATPVWARRSEEKKKRYCRNEKEYLRQREPSLGVRRVNNMIYLGGILAGDDGSAMVGIGDGVIRVIFGGARGIDEILSWCLNGLFEV